jgi:phage terminase large subunit-like protein
LSSHPLHSDPTTEYARDVIAGRYVVGRLVRLACERHIRDLETGAARGLRFDAEEASAAIAFWELCPHLKGRAAKRGETLRLEPWQAFVIGSVYGWQRADGRGGSGSRGLSWHGRTVKRRWSTRHCSTGWPSTARKGPKFIRSRQSATKPSWCSTSLSGRQSGPRTSRPKSPPTLTTWNMRRRSLSAEAVSADADTLDGLNPSVAVCDEIHKWHGRDLWDVIETGMGAREQPLLWAITTAGREGDEDVYGQEHDHCEQILTGLIEDDSRFAFIASVDPEDDWTSPAVWVKANPNMGVSVRQVEIAEQVAKAKAMPAAAPAVKRLRLGLRAQDSDCWIPLDLWDRGRRPELTWDALKGYPCFAGLDLASTCDLAALSLCFPLTDDLRPAPDPDRPACWGYLFRLWMPREGRSHREQKLREIAEPWIASGWVRATDGDAIDHGVIEAAVIEAAGHFDLRGVAYDPFNAAQLATRLQAEGIDVQKFPQNLGAFAGPTQQLETDILNGWVRHDGNPCVRWMVNNAVAVGNGAGHRMPSRKRSSNKIDGVVAMTMARGRAMVGAAALRGTIQTVWRLCELYRLQ